MRWIDAPKEGTEPASPAPVLELTAAEAGHHGGTKGGDDAKNSSGSKDGDHGKEHVSASDDESDGTARILAVVGIVVGAAGVAFGVLAGRRRTS